MKQFLIKILAATTVCAGLQSAAHAHDFTADIAQFNKTAAAKKWTVKKLLQRVLRLSFWPKSLLMTRLKTKALTA